MERDRNKKLDHFLIMDKQGQAWAAIITEIKRRIETGPRGTVTELARLLQTTRGTVSRWVKGSLKGERMPYDKVCFMLEQLGLDARVYFGSENRQPWATPPLGGVPLIGLAACGHDLWTRERMNLTVPRPGDQAYNAELFAVVAMGYSMRPAGIEPGFILYCDPLTRVDEGDTVFVEKYDDTVTLKKFRRVEGAWTILEGWTPPTSDGRQDIYTASTLTENIKRLVTIIYIKCKI